MIIKGAFNELLRPGLMEDIIGVASERSGVSEVCLGKPYKRRLEDTPNALDDWPKKWWEENDS